MSFSGAAGAERKPNNLASLDNYISFEKFLKSKNFPPSPPGARLTPLNLALLDKNLTTKADALRKYNSSVGSAATFSSRSKVKTGLRP